MKNLELTFAARLGISNFLGQATGPLGKISSLQRINEKVRFSDEESGQIKVEQLGNGLSSYFAPSPEFGRKTVQVEDADAAVLTAEIEACQQFRISDLAWLEPLKAQLNGSH